MKKEFLLLLLLIPINIFAQILNIEQERLTADTGWSGEAKVSLQIIKNTNTVTDGAGRIHIQYKTKQNLYLILGEYSLIKTSNTDLVNRGFEHLRYNYKINDWLIAEAFTQAQFNKLLKVKFRGLVGAGTRFKIIGSDNFNLFVASLYMYEYEELEESSEIHRDHRLSNYLSVSFKLSKTLKLINTSYFQPKFNDFSDYRVSTQANLKFVISKRLSYYLTYDLLYDTKPPEGIVSTTYSLTNGLSFSF